MHLLCLSNSYSRRSFPLFPPTLTPCPPPSLFSPSIKLRSFDSLLPSEYQARVFVHRFTPPNSNTLLVATLGAGEGYASPTTGLRIAVGAITATTAVLNLDGYNPLTCEAKAPVVTVSPLSPTVISVGCSQPQVVSFEVRGCAFHMICCFMRTVTQCVEPVAHLHEACFTLACYTLASIAH